jgi:hypothetical protein
LANDYRPFLLILPEDDPFAGMANGFLEQCQPYVRARVEPFGKGKPGLRKRVLNLLNSLTRHPDRYLVVIFDGDGESDPMNFWLEVCEICPPSRVFFLWTRDEAENLRSELLAAGQLAKANSWERIGRLLADECRLGEWRLWLSSQLKGCSHLLDEAHSELKNLLFP